MIFRAPELDDRDQAVLNKVIELKSELDFMVPPGRWFGSLRRDTLARAVRGSNSIEGYEISLNDAHAVVEDEEVFDVEEETRMAVSGYRAAMTLVLQKEEDLYFSFNHDFLNALHFMMVGYDLSKNPGRWRPGAVFVYDEAKEERVYEAPSVDLVPGLMDELMLDLNSPGDTHPIIRGAMAHLNYVMIHPHSDGNGRMARCLQTLVLARGSMGRNRIFVSIEEYLGRNTPEYYEVLLNVGNRAWHPERDAHPWIRFNLTAHYRQAMTMKQRAERWGRIFALIENEVERRGLHERSIVPISQAAYGFRIRNSNYRRDAEVSDALASKDLKELVDAEVLLPHGERRGRYYTAGKVLDELMKDVPHPKRPGDPYVELGAVQGSLFTS